MEKHASNYSEKKKDAAGSTTGAPRRHTAEVKYERVARHQQQRHKLNDNLDDLA